MTEIQTCRFAAQAPASVEAVLDSYGQWVETLASYMKHATDLLEGLYAEQDQILEQLRTLCAKSHSLRRADFDALFGPILARRSAPRASLASLVDGYRAGREAVIREVREALQSDAARALQAWPGLKERLRGEREEGVAPIVAALRQVHMEQERLSAALSGLLARGPKLKIDELRTVAQRLATQDSRESVELAALLAVCERASQNAGRKWERLAG